MAALLVAVYFIVLFAFSRLSVERYTDESSLAAFFGLFQGVATGTGLALSFFVSKWLYSRIGFIGSLLAYSVVFIAGFAISGIFPQFAPIVLFRYIQVAAYLGVAGPAYQAVFNVAPRTSREQIRLFVDGVLIQVGMLIAGVVLIALRAAPGLRLHLAVGFVLAAIATVFAFVARARYGGAVLAALRDGVGTLFDHPTSAPSTPDNRAAKVAIEALQAKDPATRRAAAATMASIRASEAVDCIVKSLDDSDAEVRRLCLDAIAIHQLTEATLEVHRMLSDEDARVRRAAVITIGALAKYPRGMVRALEPMLADLDPSIGATAAGCILSAGEEGAGREFVTAFLHSGEAKKIIIALEAFKRAPGAMPVTTIVKFLCNYSPQRSP